MQTKKWMAGVLGAVMAISVLSGCGSKGSQGPDATKEPAQQQQQKAPEPVTLEFWTINLKKNFAQYITGTIDGYKKLHPEVTINWVDVPGGEVDTKLLTSLAGGQPPDVVNMDSPLLFKFEGALTDLGQYAKPEQIAEYTDTLVNSVKQNGKVVAIPWYYGGPPVAVYNQEMIKKAGLDLSNPPKTLDDILAWGKTIHDKTGVYGSNTLPDSMLFQMEGIPLVTADHKKAAFNTPEAVALLNKWYDGFKAGSTAPGAIIKDTRLYPQTLDNEQVAMAVGGAWKLNDYEKNSPQVFAKLKVAAAPVGKTGKQLIQGIQTFIVPAKSKHPKEAADFLFYFSNAENQLAFCKLVAIFPSTKKTLADPFFTNVQGTKPQDEGRKVMVQELSQAADATLGTGMDDDLRQLLDEQVRAFYLNKKDAKTALADAEKQWNDKLAGK